MHPYPWIAQMCLASRSALRKAQRVFWSTVLALHLAPSAIAQTPSAQGVATGLWVQPDTAGSDVVLGLIDARLWRLSPDGRTSINIGPGGGAIPVRTFAITPTTISATFTSTIYVGTPSNGAYKTTDAGQTWEPINYGDPCSTVSNYAVINTSVHLLITRCESIDTLMVSNDGGVNWARRYTLPQGVRTNRLSLSLNDSNRSYLYTTQGLYFSQDSGLTWSNVRDANPATGFAQVFAAIPVDANVRDYRSSNSSTTPPRAEAAMIEGVGIFYSPNTLGAQFQPLALLNTGLPSTGFGNRMSRVNGQFYVPVVGHGLYRFDSAGTAWELAISEQAIPGIDEVYQFNSDPNIWFARSRTSGIWRSTDGAATWTRWGIATTVEIFPDTDFSVPQGLIPSGQVTVSTSGTTENRTLVVELRLPENASTRSFPPRGISATRETTSALQVFIVALVPSGVLTPIPVILLKDETGSWGSAAFPLAAFLRNVSLGSQDTRVLLEILKDNNVAGLVGTEFYIGYGTSGDEMLALQRYRGIYKIK